MSSKAAWLKAGLSLLCIVALAVFASAPAQRSLGALRANVAEMPAENKEHRDSEKLRERLHGATPQRRAVDHAARSKPLPVSMQQTPVPSSVERPARGNVFRPRESIDEWVRTRVSPPSLQVFRR